MKYFLFACIAIPVSVLSKIDTCDIYSVIIKSITLNGEQIAIDSMPQDHNRLYWRDSTELAFLLKDEIKDVGASDFWNELFPRNKIKNYTESNSRISCSKKFRKIKKNKLTPVYFSPLSITSNGKFAFCFIQK